MDCGLMGGPFVPDPPDEPAAGRGCDAGYCAQPSVGWRWFTDMREWLPVCERCMGTKGVPRRFRAYDADFWDFAD